MPPGNPRSAPSSRPPGPPVGRDQQTLVTSLAAAGHLRPGLDVQTAADAMYALVNEEVYLLLVIDCGWDLARFERWLADTLRHQLLDPAASRA